MNHLIDDRASGRKRVTIDPLAYGSTEFDMFDGYSIEVSLEDFQRYLLITKNRKRLFIENRPGVYR